MMKINLLIAGALTLGLAACGTEETEVKTKKETKQEKAKKAEEQRKAGENVKQEQVA
ncbi:hypothetical protein IEC_05389 [Bacillus toyonensis]|uniref:hypothetical protein n=1 Tax=Bacillus toyonensis TaxID=155322 RepID=UPI000278BEB5|nr:hypothetical protein [Bacillus toyonensis]EJQ32377.1 hypothetical protein IEC_05389 [Bacillus toyonensis]